MSRELSVLEEAPAAANLQPLLSLVSQGFSAAVIPGTAAVPDYTNGFPEPGPDASKEQEPMCKRDPFPSPGIASGRECKAGMGKPEVGARGITEGTGDRSTSNGFATLLVPAGHGAVQPKFLFADAPTCRP